jgi:peptide chain release factor subunit 1
MDNIEKFKIKRLIKDLSSYRGNGTSMISLVVPAGYQISLISKMLTVELGTASNIKSRVNRQSVMSAITSTQAKLKRYSRTPKNGLVIYCGEASKDGKPKKLNIDFEPFKPMTQKVYMCDDHFHTEYLGELLEDSDRFGFVIMDGNGINIYSVCGTDTERLAKYEVDLTSKTRRGGQSALRFSRLRDEEKANFLRKATEMCKKAFIGNSNLPQVKGIILAGKAHFKSKLAESPLLDGRLKKIILKILEVGYGGENGFQQAIEMSQEVLADVKLMEEKKIMSQFMEHIAKETGKYCYGIKEVCDCLDETVISDLIVYEDLDLFVVTVYNSETNEDETKYMTRKEMEDSSLNIKGEQEYVDYISERYKDYGCKLHIVSDKTAVGNQIVSGFGGLCGILRWKREHTNYEPTNEDEDLEDLDNFDLGEYGEYEEDFI